MGKSHTTVPQTCTHIHITIDRVVFPSSHHHNLLIEFLTTARDVPFGVAQLVESSMRHKHAAPPNTVDGSTTLVNTDTPLPYDCPAQAAHRSHKEERTSGCATWKLREAPPQWAHLHRPVSAGPAGYQSHCNSSMLSTASRSAGPRTHTKYRQLSEQCN